MWFDFKSRYSSLTRWLLQAWLIKQRPFSGVMILIRMFYTQKTHTHTHAGKEKERERGSSRVEENQTASKDKMNYSLRMHAIILKDELLLSCALCLQLSY